MGQEQRVKDLGCKAKLVTMHHGSIYFVVGSFCFFGAGDVTQNLADAKQVSTPRAELLFLKEV